MNNKRWLLLILAVACEPDLGQRESLITRMRVLAVRGDPPEAKKDVVVRYSMLLATPEGAITTNAAWSYCRAPKFLTENGAVTARCTQEDGPLQPLGVGPSVEAAIPSDVCAIFGPEIASDDLRPRDPDVTGGYYQPVRVALPGTDVAFGLQRVYCGLGNAGNRDVADYTARYKPNENPVLGRFTIDGIETDAVSAGARVRLRQEWPVTESFLVYDLAAQRMVERRESMRLSWFTTAGVLDRDRTGRSEEELETFTENDFTAPTATGPVSLFVVLRDARGGVAFAAHTVMVR